MIAVDGLSSGTGSIIPARSPSAVSVLSKRNAVTWMEGVPLKASKRERTGIASRLSTLIANAETSAPCSTTTIADRSVAVNGMLTTIGSGAHAQNATMHVIDAA